MLPKVIVHNEISLDGSIKGFEPNIRRYYEIAARYRPDIVLVGSITAKTGIETYVKDVPSEEKIDFIKPEIQLDDKRPFWAIPDTRGTLKNLLHVFRRADYCKDIIILVSKSTPSSYLNYLKERNYDHIIMGEDHVDYQKAFELLCKSYNCKIILTDSGGKLNNILLERGLVDEISLLISPILVGNKYRLFKSLKLKDRSGKLRLLKNEVIDDNYVLLVYKISKQ